MYKLTCISGKDLQKSFILKDGENLIGRASDTHIKVDSPGISKIHARVVQEGDRLFVEDLNSSNGTFVNGVLITKKELKEGDRVSFYDAVYEVASISSQVNTDFDSIDLPEDFETKKAVSATFVTKFVNFIDNTVLPIFISMLSKYTFLTIVAALLIIVSVFTAFIITLPIVKFDESLIRKEASKRAIFVATSLAKDNENKISLESDAQPTTKFASSVPGITNAFITDIEGGILAPEEYVGQNLPGSAMIGIQKIIKNQYKSFEEISEGGAILNKINTNKYIATAPILSYSDEEGSSNYKGFAVVMFDTKLVQHSQNSAWQKILIGIAISGFIWLLIAFIISRLFNFPFNKMYDELDLALKGDSRRIVFSPKSQSVQNLVELLNMMVRRLKRLSASLASNTSITNIGSVQNVSLDEQFIFESVGIALKSPFFVVDENNVITYNNSDFANLASYNARDWIGTSIVDVISDNDILGSVLSIIPRVKETGSDLTDSLEKGAKLIRVTGSPVKDDKGEVLYIVFIIEST